MDPAFLRRLPYKIEVGAPSVDSFRRIFTDGRSFPADAEPAFVGYSIGKTSVTFGTNWLIPRDLPNLTLNLASMDSRQLYSFWVAAVDAAGNVGKKRYLMNVYKP